MNRRDDILKVLKRINTILLNDGHQQTPGLFFGNCGIILYLSNYYRYIDKDVQMLSKISSLLESVIVQANALPIDFTLGNGYAGITWLLEHLTRHNLLDLKHKQQIADLHRAIANSIETDIIQNEFDYPYGFTGKYAVINNSFKIYLSDKIRQWYELNFIRHENKYSFICDEQDSINLGFAHGLPSIAYFLRVYNILSDNEFSDMLRCLIDIHRIRRFSHKNVTIFPHFQPSDSFLKGEIDKSDSRFAWCFGDLGVLYMLASSYKFNQTNSLKDLIADTISVSNKRNIQNSLVSYFKTYDCYDIGFCHGLAGIYHLHKRINNCLDDSDILLNCNYWFDKLLENSNILLEQMPQKGYINDNNDNMLNLPSGIAGLGLVLLSDITSDYEWDFCFMIK